MKIGVAVSTHKRPATVAKALRGWAEAELPHVLVVTNDDTGQGVAATKNRGIAALMDAGCTHLFLCDDDVWPVRSHWWSVYVRNPQPHLMHCWGQRRFIGTAPDHVSVWSWPRGVLLYAERRVIDRVGGMRVEFGDVGGEHVEWSRRIHNAGLTAHPFQDAETARKGIWHCEDYTRAVASSMSARRYEDGPTRQRHALYDMFRHSDEFVPYRTGDG